MSKKTVPSTARACPQCGGVVPAVPVGRPRRFCSIDCRYAFHAVSSAMVNDVRWLRDRAEDSRRNAQRHPAIAADWLRSARQLEAQADELEELLLTRRADR